MSMKKYANMGMTNPGISSLQTQIRHSHIRHSHIRYSHIFSFYLMIFLISPNSSFISVLVRRKSRAVSFVIREKMMNW
jgi:hypothetical protein